MQTEPCLRPEIEEPEPRRKGQKSTNPSRARSTCFLGCFPRPTGGPGQATRPSPFHRSPSHPGSSPSGRLHRHPPVSLPLTGAWAPRRPRGRTLVRPDARPSHARNCAVRPAVAPCPRIPLPFSTQRPGLLNISKPPWGPLSEPPRKMYNANIGTMKGVCPKYWAL